jgi:N-acetylglucosamine malate deacetylase 2
LSAHDKAFSFPEGTWVLAAHPDDEAVGAGIALGSSRRCVVVHLTAGAPASRSLWPAAFAGKTREEYARARAEEARQALSVVNVEPERILSLGAPDQESVHHLAPLARRFAQLLAQHSPPRIVTHPYEGGHPDHDAAAFVAHAAVALLDRSGSPAPSLWEMTSYHARGDGLEAGEFLGDLSEVEMVELSETQRALKRRMIDSYGSQREVLAAFPLRVERFRPAPRYPFRAPPHPGQLWYERMGWAIGLQWRAHAVSALEELGFAEVACL